MAESIESDEFDKIHPQHHASILLYIARNIGTSILQNISQILPHLLWFITVLTVLVLFGSSVRKILDGAAISKVGIGPVEIRFAEQSALSIPSREGVPRTPQEFKPIADRAQAMSKQLKDAHVLWVDDKPSNNVHERRVLEAFGIHFDLSNSTDDALEWLSRANYDAVISNLQRKNDPSNDELCITNPVRSGAGCALAKRVGEKSDNYSPPLILYTGTYPKSHGRPAYFFGATERPDDLFQLVLDALARRRIAEL